MNPSQSERLLGEKAIAVPLCAASSFRVVDAQIAGADPEIVRQFQAAHAGVVPVAAASRMVCVAIHPLPSGAVAVRPPVERGMMIEGVCKSPIAWP